MKPKEIQENLELAQNLLGQWLRYRQFYLKGISGESISPDEETQFLETTSAVAQNIRKLGQRIDEKQWPFRKEEISNQLKGTISIGHFGAIPEADQKKFYNEWHVNMLYLSRTVGALKFMNEGYVPAPPKVAGVAKKGAKGKAGGAMMKKVVILIVLAAAAVGGFLAVQAFL
ncbi:hypothetical protein BH09SUM1_BH09SUM1_25040 [soil metagenome]